MPREKETDINYAKRIALKYLSYAPRSISEVELKLKEKGIKDDVIKKVLHYLKNLSYLNDNIFAHQWACSKIKSRLWGEKKIVHSLKIKGISEEIIRQTISDLGINEVNTAKLALNKFLKNKALPPDALEENKIKQIARAYRHLLAKGFVPDVIQKAMKAVKMDFNISLTWTED